MRPARTFVEEARRQQLARAAIGTIAERGLAAASLAGIAEAAGVAKGLVSYHFAGKDELLRHVLATLLRDAAAFIGARVPRTGPAPDRLRAFVAASFAFMRSHRANLAAWLELWASCRAAPGLHGFDASVYAQCRAAVERIVRDGVRRREFRRVAPATAAVVIQGAIDGVMLQWLLDERAVRLDDAERAVLEMVEAWTAPRR